MAVQLTIVLALAFALPKLAFAGAAQSSCEGGKCRVEVPEDEVSLVQTKIQSKKIPDDQDFPEDAILDAAQSFDMNAELWKEEWCLMANKKRLDQATCDKLVEEEEGNCKDSKEMKGGKKFTAEQKCKEFTEASEKVKKDLNNKPSQKIKCAAPICEAAAEKALKEFSWPTLCKQMEEDAKKNGGEAPADCSDKDHNDKLTTAAYWSAWGDFGMDGCLAGKESVGLFKCTDDMNKAFAVGKAFTKKPGEAETAFGMLQSTVRDQILKCMCVSRLQGKADEKICYEGSQGIPKDKNWCYLVIPSWKRKFKGAGDDKFDPKCEKNPAPQCAKA